ncbi:MAG: DUF4440 domain-containing protein [Verrucomicrobiota bacterium]
MASSKMSASDKSQIIALDQAWGDAASSGRLADVVGFYAANATLVWPGTKAVQGTAAIRKSWKGMFRQFKGLRLRFIAKAIHISKEGDLASDFGVVEFSATGQSMMKAKYLVVWQKVRGEWRVLYDSWNTNTEAPAPAAKSSATKGTRKGAAK